MSCPPPIFIGNHTLAVHGTHGTYSLRWFKNCRHNKNVKEHILYVFFLKKGGTCALCPYTLHTHYGNYTHSFVIAIEFMTIFTISFNQIINGKVIMSTPGEKSLLCSGMNPNSKYDICSKSFSPAVIVRSSPILIISKWIDIISEKIEMMVSSINFVHKDDCKCTY